MPFQDIDSLQRHFEALMDYAAHLYAVARAQNDETAAALIRDQWFRLRQGPVRTLVLGVSSAGKSTLINAMAGQIVVPEGKQTTSPIPVWVYRDDTPPDKPRIRILKKQDIEPLNCGRFSYLTDYCYTAAEAGRGTGQEKYRDLKAAVVDVNSPALATAGVTLIDTPGIGVSYGDDARVQEVLADGCEMLVILFMDLHQQEVKDYFAALLAVEHAPLRDLLDRGRVFLVLNATDEKHADPYAVLDTREHIRDAFDGWDGDDRLFVFNALDARIAACGTYAYQDLLPKGYSEEEMAHAAATEQLERERAAFAQPQEGLDTLCEALGMAVQDLCASEADVEKLLHPILQGLEEAAGRLEQPWLDRIDRIRNADYAAPGEIEQRRRRLQNRVNGLQEHMEEFSIILSGSVAKSRSRWPEDTVAAGLLAGNQICNYQLMGSSRDEADETMVELIQRSDGLTRWIDLLNVKLTDLRHKLYVMLTDRDHNPELVFWWETFHRMKHYAESRTDGDNNAVIPAEQVDAFRTRMEYALKQASEAGKQDMEGRGVFSVSADEQSKICQYFLEKRKKIEEGSLLNGWRLFWLYPDVATEILNPLLDRVVREGTEAFLSGFRGKLWSFMPMLRQQYTAMLTDASLKLGVLLAKTKEEICQARDSARTADLEQAHRELAALGLRNPELTGKE